MEREIIRIDKIILLDIIREDNEEEFTLVENKITSSDPEDGGADHNVVIKRLSDQKYFRVFYTDWDMDYNFNRDFPEELTEVFPREVITTIYV